MISPNQPAPASPAGASPFQAERQWRGVADPERSARNRCNMKRKVIAAICVWLSGLAAEDSIFPKLPDSPITLIDTLKTSGDRYTIGNVRVDYVKESDIPHLVSLLDSKEACGFVDMSISSIRSPGKSTVGHEAAYLIEGFWKRYYPTDLTSQQYKPDIESMKRWYGFWSRWKKLAEQSRSSEPGPPPPSPIEAPRGPGH